MRFYANKNISVATLTDQNITIIKKCAHSSILDYNYVYMYGLIIGLKAAKELGYQNVIVLLN